MNDEEKEDEKEDEEQVNTIDHDKNNKNNNYLNKSPDFLSNNIKKPQDSEIKSIAVDIPFVSRISYYIEEKKKEIKRIQNIKKIIHSDITEIKRQQNIAQSNLDNTIEKERKIMTFFQWYNNLKQELQEKYNIKIEEEFENFAKVIHDFKEYDFNVSLLIKEYKDFESLKHKINLTRDEIQLNKQTIHSLQQEISNLEWTSYSYKQTMITYQELEKIGFGLKELKQLRGLVTEVSSANNITAAEAVPRFFKELEKNYDSKLGLESKIKELSFELHLLDNKIVEKQVHLALQDTAAPNLVTLYAKGLTNNDIINLTNLVLSFENSYFLDYKSIRKDNVFYTDRIDITTRNEFWKLVIKKLKDLNNLNTEIERLKTYLEDLEAKRGSYTRKEL